MGSRNAAVNFVLGMNLLFVYCECCCYLYIGNYVVCVLIMLLLFVSWECCCLCIGNAVVICLVGMMLFFR